MKKLLCGVLGAVGLAASANAAVSWTTQMQFFKNGAGPAGSPPQGLLVGNAMSTSVVGTYTFTVQVGIFNFAGGGTGDANHGLFNWTSTANASGLAGGETLGVTNSGSRAVPFTFGPATSFGGTLASASQITNINAARDVAGGAANVWNWDTNFTDGGPPPAGPNNPAGDVGVNSYTNVWKFTVTIASNAVHDIVVNFAGQAGPVIRWELFGGNPPQDNGDGTYTQGTATYLGITRSNTDGGPLAAYTAANMTIHVTPAPGSLALLGLGGLIAARRRRS